MRIINSNLDQEITNFKELVTLEFKGIRILILFKGVKDSINMVESRTPLKWYSQGLHKFSRVKDSINGVESKTPSMEES